VIINIIGFVIVIFLRPGYRRDIRIIENIKEKKPRRKFIIIGIRIIPW
jgi:hypothetical protein